MGKVVQVLLRFQASHKTTKIRKDISRPGPNPDEGRRTAKQSNDRIGSVGCKGDPVRRGGGAGMRLPGRKQARCSKLLGCFG